jgi:hypothetical protein
MSGRRILLVIVSALGLLTFLPVPRLVAGEPAEADKAVLKGAGVQTDGPSVIAFLQKRAPAGANPDKAAEYIRQLGSSTFSEREEAAQALTAMAYRAAPLLREAVKADDAQVRQLAERCLDQIERNWKPHVTLAAVRILLLEQPKGTAEALLRYLPFAVDDEEEETVWFGLSRLAADNSRILALLPPALKDPCSNRRGFAACVVGRLGNAEQRAAVCALLKDANPTVRLRAAQGLLAAGDKSGLPALLPLLTEGSIEVAWQAEELLHWAADEPPKATVGTGSRQAREECRKAWATWWDKQGEQLDLGKRRKIRAPGLFLVGEQTPGPAPEHVDKLFSVWLWGCDDQPRCRLHKARNAPKDFRLLPGGRLFQVEWPELLRPDPDKLKKWGPVVGVTERDLNGKILWQYKGIERPAVGQRLANGNTFVSDRDLHAVAEVTPEGKALWVRDYSLRLLDGRDPRRLRNGNILCFQHIPEFVGFIEFEPWDPDARPVIPLTIRRRVPLPNKPGLNFPAIEPLAGDRSLISYAVDGVAKTVEVNHAGETVWEYAHGMLSNLTRLPSGNTLALGDECVFELAADGKLVGKVALVQGEEKRLGRRYVFHVRPCLNLVRLGFDAEAPR